MGTEMVKSTQFDLAIATAEATPPELLETLQETLGGRLRPYDLQRIVWPSGKATTWEIPQAGGDTMPVKEIIALPILTTVSRQFWEKKSSGPDTTPPVCKSDDGERGHPTERGRELGATGDCRTCPLAQWGANNTPPACKERRELFILREGDMFPMVLSIPPSSLKVWKEYVRPLGFQGLPHWMAITRFKLQTATNPNGDPYAQLKLEFVGKVDPNQKEVLKQYREALMATFRAGLEATRLEQQAALGAPATPSPAAPVTTAKPKRPEFNELGEEMPLEE